MPGVAAAVTFGDLTFVEITNATGPFGRKRLSSFGLDSAQSILSFANSFSLLALLLFLLGYAQRQMHTSNPVLILFYLQESAGRGPTT